MLDALEKRSSAEEKNGEKKLPVCSFTHFQTESAVLFRPQYPRILSFEPLEFMLHMLPLPKPRHYVYLTIADPRDAVILNTIICTRQHHLSEDFRSIFDASA